MKTFLLWQQLSPGSDTRGAGRRSAPPAGAGGKPAASPAAVAQRLLQLFAPLFDPAPALTLRSEAGGHLAWLELPVAGFNAPFVEEDPGSGEQHGGASGVAPVGGAGGAPGIAPHAHSAAAVASTSARPGSARSNAPRAGWAAASEYPLNARRVLRAGGGSTPPAVLPALARALAERPAALLPELAPPFALLWSPPGSGEIHLFNDALGQAQLYRYERDGLVAVSNRLSAFTALGIALRPETAAWATRVTLGWFPEHVSGYADISNLPGGTHLRFHARGVERHRTDVLASWIAPPRRSREECLELGRLGMRALLEDALELCTEPSVGLSGGWDSRTVVSCLRTMEGARYSLRVRGEPTHFDVLVSNQLAKMAGLPLRIKSGGGVPPGTTTGARRSILMALRWQGGTTTLLKHKTFLAKGDDERLDGGVVNVMGQHAGVGKADFAVDIAAHTLPESAFEPALLEFLQKPMPPFLRTELREGVVEDLRAAYRAAQRYGLSGLHALHFFYLHEFTRRWGSATVNHQSGQVVAPFLCPDVIRACHGLPPEELPGKPLHKYITAKHTPDWAAYPYANQITDEDVASGRIPPLDGHTAAVQPLQPTGTPERWRRTLRHRKYRYGRYWKEVGAPLVEQAFSDGGFWTTLFDVDRARAEWNETKGAADALVVTHLLEHTGELDGAG